MLIKNEVNTVLEDLKGRGCYTNVALSDEEFSALSSLLVSYPELGAEDIAVMFRLMRQKLKWETIDLNSIVEPLRAFFDDKVMRDLDPLSLAKQIGHDIKSGCDGCSC